MTSTHLAVRESSGYAQTLWGARVAAVGGGWLTWLGLTQWLGLPAWIALPGAVAIGVGASGVVLAGSLLASGVREYLAECRVDGGGWRGFGRYAWGFVRDVVGRY